MIQRQNTIQYPAVLVAKEKHCTRYFDATTPEALAASAVALVRERLRDGWYYRPTPPPAPGYTVDEVPAELKCHAESKLLQYQRDLTTYDRAKEQWDMALLVERGADDGDYGHAGTRGGLALALLDLRSDYEYEDVSVHPLERAETLPTPDYLEAVLQG